jgi:non-specific serine/threonine protein kinase
LADDMGLGQQTLSTLVAVQEKLDFESRKHQLDLFGNEIPVAKEYLKALIVLPPLWCSTGTTKLEITPSF